MSFFDSIILSVILIVFPIMCVLIFKIFSNNFFKKNDYYLITIACFLSLFLLINFCYFRSVFELLFINLPFLILIFNKNKLFSLLMLFIIILFNYINGLNLYILFFEYILYYLFFLFINKNSHFYYIYMSFFLFVKGFCLVIENVFILNTNNFIFVLFKIFIDLVIFYIVSVLIFKIIKLIDNAISINNTFKELEKEKKLKTTLFKITHEVKNPLAVCKGYLSMMDYSDSKKVYKYCNIINSEIDRTLDILNNFSEYNKISVVLDLIDLNLLLEDVISLTNNLLLCNNICLNYINKYDEIFINGDYDRLKQVFVNIIKNSVEAIDSDGLIRINVILKDKFVIIKFYDNGCGIKKEDMDKIGDLFYTSKEHGSGLGVSLSKEIIKQHNGTLKFKSCYSKFTLVSVTIPLF